MALYLGNQKVSLRSGQDPTFDYGFDSNGRLVFANKNATEINNFLNYDSTYSEILDLSNLNKMERVAVNGTVDRKMEGLKGLLVSQNAPFTGSSPQINVSYTGLSKSALVSLFESAPYNVGYTKVGNPTIVDGVASGFSADNYIKTSSSIDVNYNIVNGFDLQTRIKIPSYRTGLAIHYFTGSGGVSSGLSINGAGKVYWMIGRDDTSETNISIGGGNTTTIQLDTYYYIRLKISNKIATLYTSIDGALWNTESTLDMTEMVIKTYYNRPFGFGHAGTSTNNNYIFNGSIDLNNTYIKVNVVPWFTGKPAMTKTCSIVGATGTADLTQEDKNIILNKGWSLTVQ